MQNGKLKELITRIKLMVPDAIKNKIKKIDRYSPYPIFYEFIMSYNERDFFDKNVKEAKKYLEFGLGGSTIRALQKSRCEVLTIESSSEWIKVMEKILMLKYYKMSKRLSILNVDIGPVVEWGYPASNKYEHLFHLYSTAFLKSVDILSMDLVLVDGRFRLACALKIISECYLSNNKIKILFHDFCDLKEKRYKEKYKDLLKYVDIVDKVETLYLFSIKSDISIEELDKDYEIYKIDPR